MSKTKMNVIAFIVAGGICAYYISILGSEGALMERFPDIDPKIVVKAHRKMLRNAMMGKYNDIDTSIDENLDPIFLGIVHDLTK